MNIPNQLSILRFICAPILLLLAWSGHGNYFLLLLVFAFILDAVDGPLARRLHQESEIGSRLDSYADVAIYIVFMVGAWWLWPDIIKRESVFMLILAGSIVFPSVIGFIKFHRATSYHTWLVKLAAITISITGILLFLGGPALLFRISCIICLLAAVEEVLISLILSEPYSNVKTLWHVLKSRKFRD